MKSEGKEEPQIKIGSEVRIPPPPDERPNIARIKRTGKVVAIQGQYAKVEVLYGGCRIGWKGYLSDLELTRADEHHGR